MTRIGDKFRDLRSTGQKGFIPFVTAGDPDLATSLEIVLALAERADFIELGIPFSDPMADGPTIQASSHRALANGTSLHGVLKLVREFRESSNVPIVLFSYLNPILRFDVEHFASEARTAGVDGILVVDIVDEEAEKFSSIMRKNNIDLISLIAPTTTDERLRKIAASASGFIYAVSVAGVTGARLQTSLAAKTLVGRARRFTELPIAVGFGISNRQQIEDVWRYADAAVVGSAIVKQIEVASVKGDVVRRVRGFVHDLLPQVAKEAFES